MSAALRPPLYAAVAASLFTLGLKAAAYLYTGSVGLFADAAESTINLLASLTALGSLWYASRPVDADHTYGHEKIVYFSTGLEGLLIALAALGTATYAVLRLLRPIELQRLEVGAAIALAASVVNWAVARWLLRVGRQHGSLILVADGQHLMTDVWTSVAVVTGLGLAAFTGVSVLDPIFALAMAAYILHTGWQLMARAFNGLMDRALPDDELAAVRRAVDSQLGAGWAFHALRTRQAGSRKFVEFHLLVPGSMFVRQAHAHADRVENAIQQALPDAEVTIHIEPVEDEASWHDSALIDVELRNESPSPK